MAPFIGRIAQLVEQRIEDPCVVGSIPALAILVGCLLRLTDLFFGRFY